MGVDYTSGHGYGIAVPEPYTHEDSINAALNALFPEKHHIPFDGTIHEAIENLWEELLELGVHPQIQGNYWSGEGMHLLFLVEGTEVFHPERSEYLKVFEQWESDQKDKTGLQRVALALNEHKISYSPPGWIFYKTVI